MCYIIANKGCQLNGHLIKFSCMCSSIELLAVCLLRSYYKGMSTEWTLDQITENCFAFVATIKPLYFEFRGAYTYYRICDYNF